MANSYRFFAGAFAAVFAGAFAAGLAAVLAAGFFATGIDSLLLGHLCDRAVSTRKKYMRRYT